MEKIEDNKIIINYIYLLQEREFIKTKENIYKIGRTKKENYFRFNQYPNGSILLFQMICNNCENIEGQIIKKFHEIFNQRKEIGNEYFEGDYKIMIDIIYLIIKNEINLNNFCNILNNDDKLDIIDETKNLIQLPTTNYQNDLKNLSKSPIEQWLHDFTLQNIENNTIIHSSKEIYILFIKWCEINNSEYKITSIQFSVRLKHLNITGIYKGNHTKNGETKILNILELKKYFKIELPSSSNEK